MSISRVNFALNELVVSVDPAARTLIYSASNGTGNIAAATAYNSDASAVDVTVCILDDSTLTGPARITETVSVPAGGVVSLANLIGHNIPANGSIQAYAGTTNVVSLVLSGTTKV